MILSTIYEYRSGAFKSTGSWGGSTRDVEQSLSASNNNDRRAEYADKNLGTEEQQRITVLSAGDGEKSLAKVIAVAPVPLRKEDAPAVERGSPFFPLRDNRQKISSKIWDRNYTVCVCYRGIVELSAGLQPDHQWK